MASSMTIDILIVDDSNFFQRRLQKIINQHSKLKVVGLASNGREAIDKVKMLKPDVVTMDYEMPMMDGLTAVRAIMAENPLPILMLSSMTFEGARITLDALDAGAMDFMTKNFAEISSDNPAFKKRIYDTLLALGADALAKKAEQEISVLSAKQSTQAPVAEVRVSSLSLTKVIILAASTGGPAALTDLLKDIPASFPIPILVVQHMPETFTAAFAERLDGLCALTVKEASTGDTLQAGKVLIAPGGQHTIMDSEHLGRVKIIRSNRQVNYTPNIDITFASMSNTFGKDVLAIVLTGMGSDGVDGARLLKEKGAKVWTQNEESCLIYGMPKNIEEANLSDASMHIDEIRQQLLNF